MQQKVSYAYLISGYNLDFVLTIHGENNFWTEDRRHDIPYGCPMTGRIVHDYGFGVSACYHPSIVGDPRFFDWPWQLDQVWKLYSSGTKFYAFDVRNRYRHLFEVK
jgi:hypothetical protein